MKLSVQMYTVRDYTKSSKKILESLKKLKSIGYDAIQLSAMKPIDPYELKDYLDMTGITVCGTHTDYKDIINNTDKVIKEHKIYNTKYVGLGLMPDKYRYSTEGYDAYLKEIDTAVNKFYDNGLKFVYHNHGFEFNNISSNKNKILGLEYMIEKTDSDKYGLVADFYWTQHSGYSPFMLLDKYHDRIDITHFKDMKMVKEEVKMAEIFEGNMDYQTIYDKCIAYNIEWCAIEQDTCDKNPFDSLKISYDNLKSRGMF